MKLVTRKIVSPVVLDASKFTYGRLCSKIASILLGKYNPYCAINKLTGMVVIQNLYDVKFSGKNKIYNIHHYQHSGYAGALKRITLASYITKNRMPDYLRLSVYKMMPKTHYTKLYIYRNIKVKE